MKSKKEKVEQKLSFLYDRLEDLQEVCPTEKQVSFLMNEIDYYRTELLKIEVQEHYTLIEDENY